MQNLILSPSLLAADFSDLKNEVKKVEDCHIPWLHLDVMDGHFVPNITFGPPLVASLRKVSNLFFDVHLMIDHPKFYAAAFAKSGADLICFHAEASDDIDETIEEIKNCGCQVGIAIRPGTDETVLLPYLEKLDLVLVMTVEPGFGGQSFRSECMEKLARLRQICDEKGLTLRLEVDGGINDKTGKIARENGADTLVAGTYLFGSADMEKAAAALY
ncbi:MAG: ribulose-phosphate 3-epimerase [Oscillospiraceae bacterium]|nr:ribulose-phosphate 3-epimerase [Oscillospiraceae bacterium]